MSLALQTQAGSNGDDLHWRVACNRDASSDGAFVYGSRTTGVYCCPSGPSRMRRNVVFCSDNAAGKSRGYRACLRCNPKGNSSAGAAADVAGKDCRAIEASECMPKLGELAASTDISPFHFHRQFNAVRLGSR